jgi:hypothetical protein
VVEPPAEPLCPLPAPPHPQLLEHPQPDASAEPQEDNLFQWHANVRSRDGPLAGVPIHCLLQFPDSYPAEGPAVYVYHPLPHPNLLAVWGPLRWAAAARTVRAADRLRWVGTCLVAMRAFRPTAALGALRSRTGQPLRQHRSLKPARVPHSTFLLCHAGRRWE